MVNIAVLIDASENSHKAFDEALAYRKSHSESHLFIIHAVELVNMATASGMAGMGGGIIYFDPSHYEETNNNLIQRGKHIAAEYLKLAKEDGVENVKTLVLTTDNCKEGVVEFLKEKHIDVCFCGTRGLGAVKRLFLGSFSNYIVNHAPCSVMVVKHH